MKLTALEILTGAGVEKPEEKIGAMRVRIGGVRGIVTADHKIAIQPGVEKLDVMVGDEAFEFVVPQE
ncbi:MAG: hypothetical protein WC871_02315 [Bacteroidales bacterium]|jgi:hypothetical protein